MLLIEAGRKDDYHWVHIPVGYLYCIGNPRTDWPNPYHKLLRHRNAGGEWRVEKQRLRWDILDAFAEAASQAGIPQTPELSDIGPAGLLRQHGIAVTQDLPGVGANLQDHLQIRSVYKIQGEEGSKRWGLSLNTMAHSFWGKARIGLEYALRRTGPMSMAPSQLGAFTRSSPDQSCPTIEYHVQPLSLDAFGEPRHRFNAFTASVCNLNPTSRGSVRLKTGRFEDAPATSPRPSSTRSAPPGWAVPTTRWRWSIRTCGCAAFAGCAWSMRASCP